MYYIIYFTYKFHSRPIPEKKWFMEPLVIIPLGGVLPFGSIFIEMYFIFTSFWAYKIYYVYGFMLLVFFILAVVTICVTIVCTYFLLNAEDYRWYVLKSTLVSKTTFRTPIFGGSAILSIDSLLTLSLFLYSK